MYALAAAGLPYAGPTCDFVVSQIVSAPLGFPDEEVAYAYDKTLRHGVVVLEIQGDRVRGIGWSFYLAAPLQN